MNKHDMSSVAKDLRMFVVGLGEANFDLQNPEHRQKWRDLSRAALAYARIVYAGQCIPNKE